MIPSNVETHLQGVRERYERQLLEAGAAADNTRLAQKRSQVDKKKKEQHTSCEFHVASVPAPTTVTPSTS